MSLHRLARISVANHLIDKVEDVTVVYAESNKSLNNWYNVKEVNVETLENVSWLRSANFYEQPIEALSTSEILGENICFGQNCGFWQVYFSCNGSQFKLSKPNFRLDLPSECNQQTLLISIEAEINEEKSEPCFKCHFKILTYEASCDVIKGRPTSRSVEITIRNTLDSKLEDVNLIFSEMDVLTSKQKLTENKKNPFENSNRIQLECHDIEVDECTKSREKLLFTSFGHHHFWQLHFTYNNSCYELDSGNKKLGSSADLHSQDHGFMVDVTIFQLSGTTEIGVRFNMNGQAKTVPVKKRWTVAERNNKIRETAKELNSPELVSKFLGVLTSLIYSLRALARQGYNKSIVLGKQKWLSYKRNPLECWSSRFFHPALHPKVRFLGVALGNTELSVAIFVLESDPEICEIIKDIHEKLCLLKEVWAEVQSLAIKLKVLLMDIAVRLNTLPPDLQIDDNEELDLKNINQNLNNINSMQVVATLGQILSLSGFDEIGLTFWTSVKKTAREVAVKPGMLAMALEEELKLWQQMAFSQGTVEDSQKNEDSNDEANNSKLEKSFRMRTPPTDQLSLFQCLSISQNSLFRVTELFRLVRIELIDSLIDVAAALHLKNRDVDISMITSSVVGIAGAGMVVAGLFLAPFTAGLSSGFVATGIGLGVSGGALGVGATIADGVLTQRFLESTLDLALKDRLLCRLIAELQTRVDEQKAIAGQTSAEVCNNIPSMSPEHSQYKSKAIAESTAGAVSNVGVVALKTGVQVAKTAVFRVGSVTVGVVFDLATLTFRAINLSKGGRCELGFKLEVEVTELEQELCEVLSLFEEPFQSSGSEHTDDSLHLTCQLVDLI